MEKMQKGGYATNRPNRGEVVKFEVLTEARLDELAALDGVIPIAGEIVAGAVSVTNEYGATWCMPVEDFNRRYVQCEV